MKSNCPVCGEPFTASEGIVTVAIPASDRVVRGVFFHAEIAAEPEQIKDIVCGKGCALRRIGDAMDVMLGVKPAADMRPVGQTKEAGA